MFWHWSLRALIISGVLIALSAAAPAQPPAAGIASGNVGDVLPNGGRPQRRVEMPAIKDWSSLRITLRRGVCFGPCPAYAVQIRGDGTVVYDAESDAAVLGRHTSRLPVEAVRDLFERFRNADFFWLYDKYEATIFDIPSYSLTVAYDGLQKQVIDYGGGNIGMPIEVTTLEDAVDQVADSEKWLKFTPRTLPALAVEGWDFRAQSEANLSLLASLIQAGADALVVSDLIARGAPVNVGLKDNPERTALTVASGKGDVAAARILMDAGAARGDEDQLGRALLEALKNGELQMMRLLISRGADPLYRDAFGTTTLLAAVESSNIEMIEELLKLHPDINAHDTEAGETALIKQVRWLNPPETAAVITQMLIEAGADVNAKDNRGNTALINVTTSPEQVEVLLAAGADVNARNEENETALIKCYTAEVAYRLLSHGADYSLKSSFGETALENARANYGSEAKAIVLEYWRRYR